MCKLTIYNPNKWLNSLRVKPLKAPTVRRDKIKRLIRTAQLTANEHIKNLRDSDNPQCIKLCQHYEGKTDAYRMILEALENRPILLQNEGSPPEQCENLQNFTSRS